MEYILLNALPIVAATAIGLMAGLGIRAAAERIGPSAAAPGRGLTPVGLAAIALSQAWLAAILAGALILAPSEAGVWTMAIGSAVVIWIGFVVPATVVNSVHRALPPRAAAVDAGAWLGVMVVQAVVLQAIGLVPPNG
jgi:hypothetical protein